MSILLPSRHLLQPQGAARINWSNPITRGLVTVFLPGTPNHRDLVGGATDTAQYRAPLGAGALGLALSNTSGGNPWTTSIPISHVAGGYAALTSFCLYEPLDTTTYGMIFGAGETGTYPQYFYKNSNGTMSFAPSTNSGGLDVTTSSVLSANKVYSLCGIARYNENFRQLYVDGVNIGTNTVNGTRINTGFTFLGSQYSGGVNRCLRVYAFYCWTRELSATEVLSLTHNPWQIFVPQQRKRIHHIDFGSAPTTGWTYRARQAPSQQPASPVLNSGHPMADGLVAWQTGTAPNDFKEEGNLATPVVATAHGFARRFTYDPLGSNAQILGVRSLRSSVSTAATIAALVKPTVVQDLVSTIVGIGRFGAVNFMRIGLDGTGSQWVFTCWQSSPTVIRDVAFPYTTGDEGWHFVVGRQSSATSRDIWVDGAKGASDTVSCNPTLMTGLGVGGYPFGASFTAEGSGDVALALAWNRGLTDNEIRGLSRNPWQLFQQSRRIHAGTKIYRPYSDITTTGWTARPDAPYFRQLAETVPSDSNYIFSPDPSGSPGAFVAGLNASMEAGTYNIKFRARKTTSAGQIRATLLDASGSSVGASGWIALTTGFADYTATVTSSAPAARIKLEVQP